MDRCRSEARAHVSALVARAKVRARCLASGGGGAYGRGGGGGGAAAFAAASAVLAALGAKPPQGGGPEHLRRAVRLARAQFHPDRHARREPRDRAVAEEAFKAIADLGVG